MRKHYFLAVLGAGTLATLVLLPRAAQSSSGSAPGKAASRVFEVSAASGEVAYFQVSANGHSCLFRDAAGSRLSISNDGVYYPGFTVTFSQPGQKWQIRRFSGLLWYEQKQPSPVLFDFSGQYVAGIGDGADAEKDLMSRAWTAYNKLPEPFRGVLTSFYRFSANANISDITIETAIIEDLINQGPERVQPYEVQKREIVDNTEKGKILSLLSPG